MTCLFQSALTKQNTMKISDSDYIEKRDYILELMQKDSAYCKVHILSEALVKKYQTEPMHRKKARMKFLWPYLGRMIEEELIHFSEAGGVLLAWPTDKTRWPHD